ncbi:YczE/YyaS/YitT family protein [Paenisporosarcina indica]|uniref:YczE/YyaS/YitT family protein n=1 Tax=Paenisporosarcina indica TaxID=650093 RepID=UPI0009502155|nr:YitT family protein [Paenisporosarcina indica]
MNSSLWRWTFFFVGLLIFSLGITLCIKGQSLGISPWDVLHVGLNIHFGLTIGTWSIITGLLLVTGTALVTKSWPQIGTWLNMIAIGLFIDLFNWMIPDVSNLAGQIILFILGVVIMGLGVGVYVSANVGAGPRDSVMLVLMKKTGWSIKRVRTLLETGVGIIGWLLGGPVGIGTILVALCLGQIVQMTLPWSQARLQKCIERQQVAAPQR